MIEIPKFKWIAFLDVGQSETLNFYFAPLNFWLRNEVLRDEYLLADLPTEVIKLIAEEITPGYCEMKCGNDFDLNYLYESIDIFTKNGILYGGEMD